MIEEMACDVEPAVGVSTGGGMALTGAIGAGPDEASTAVVGGLSEVGGIDAGGSGCRIWAIAGEEGGGLTTGLPAGGAAAARA